MATTTSQMTPDLPAIKARQQKTWASGDFSAVAALIVPVAENLVDHADLRAGWNVLDVATGSGNAAIAAARLGCNATGIDYVPALLERGRERAEAERLSIDFLEADAEALPFADASFDAVLSAYGSMFAPDHERTAGEIVRVCRPGGRIALASWTPSGFLGAVFRAITGHVPPPAGLASPLLWGTPEHLEGVFGDEAEWLRHEPRIFTFRFVSPEAFVAFFAEYYGPTVKAFEALDDAGQASLELELCELARSWDRLQERGAVAIPAEYLESVGIRNEAPRG